MPSTKTRRTASAVARRPARARVASTGPRHHNRLPHIELRPIAGCSTRHASLRARIARRSRRPIRSPSFRASIRPIRTAVLHAAAVAAVLHAIAIAPARAFRRRTRRARRHRAEALPVATASSTFAPSRRTGIPRPRRRIPIRRATVPFFRPRTAHARLAKAARTFVATRTFI